MFSGLEISNKLKEAMRKRTQDNGRNFSFITGFVFALVLAIAVYFSGRVILKLMEE